MGQLEHYAHPAGLSPEGSTRRMPHGCNNVVTAWPNGNSVLGLDISIRLYLYGFCARDPYVVAVMLQGDPLKCSVYRDEAVEAITAALDCHICNEKVQEQSARALLILGGRFSYTGVPTAEKQLLKEAGFDDSSGDSFNGKDIVVDKFIHLVSF